jgi:hypothetical protein
VDAGARDPGGDVAEDELGLPEYYVMEALVMRRPAGSD